MNEEDLRKYIATAFVYLKVQQEELFALQNQVATMRDLMKDASPKFARMFSERLEEWQIRISGESARRYAELDEIILRLRDDDKGA